MSYASTEVTETRIVNVGTGTTGLSEFIRARITEVRDTLAAAGWSLVSGQPGMPALVNVSSLVIDPTVSPWTSTGDTNQKQLSDYYKLEAGGGTELYLEIEHYLATRRGSATTGKYFHAVRVLSAWAIDSVGLVSRVGISNTAINNINDTNDRSATINAYTIQAARKPGMLAFSMGERTTTGYVCNMIGVIIERHHADDGSMLNGNDAAYNWMAVYAGTISTEQVYHQSLGTHRNSDGASAAITGFNTSTSNATSDGSGAFAQPCFPGGPVAGTTGIYDAGGLTAQPVAVALYYGARPGHSMYLVGLPAAAVPGSREIDAPNPTGGGTGHYRVMDQFAISKFSRDQHVPMVRWEAV